MFIENLRHVKKKWKIPMLIGVGLILVGLLGSYAYFGSTYNGISAGGTGAEQRIKTLESNVKALEKSVKADPDNSALVVELADNYFDLGSYRLLLLKESAAKDSFMSAVTHYQKAAQLFTGETEETTWVNLYSRWIGSNIQIGDINGAKKTFEGSLEPLPYNIEVLKAYGDQMIQAQQEDALIGHLNVYRGSAGNGRSIPYANRHHPQHRPVLSDESP